MRYVVSITKEPDYKAAMWMKADKKTGDATQATQDEVRAVIISEYKNDPDAAFGMITEEEIADITMRDIINGEDYEGNEFIYSWE